MNANDFYFKYVEDKKSDKETRRKKVNVL